MRTKVYTTYPSVFRKPKVIQELERLHEEFDKTCNKIVL